jgi:hypothetical protein
MSKQQSKGRRKVLNSSWRDTSPDDFGETIRCSQFRSIICEGDTAPPVRKAHDHYRQGGQSKTSIQKMEGFPNRKALWQESTVECDEAALGTAKPHASSVLISLSATCGGDKTKMVSLVQWPSSMPLERVALDLADIAEPAGALQAFGVQRDLRGGEGSIIAQPTLSYAIYGSIHGYLRARADVPRIREEKIWRMRSFTSCPHLDICISIMTVHKCCLNPRFRLCFV